MSLEETNKTTDISEIDAKNEPTVDDTTAMDNSDIASVSISKDELDKKVKNFTLASNILNIILSLVIPITGLFMIYACASPVAFTEYRAVNDILYTVKEIGRIDSICVIAGIVISIAVSIIFSVIYRTYKKLIDTCTSNKDMSVEETMGISDKLEKAKNSIKSNLYKAIFFDVFMVLVIITNHIINN